MYNVCHVFCFCKKYYCNNTRILTFTARSDNANLILDYRSVRTYIYSSNDLNIIFYLDNTVAKNVSKTEKLKRW